MNKSAVMLIYSTLVLAMMSLFLSSSGLLFVGKLFLLVVLAYLLFDISTRGRRDTVYHHFNILFSLAIVIFVLYSLLYKGSLFESVRMEFFLASVIGLGLSFLYVEKKVAKIRRPVKPAPRVLIKKTEKKAPAKKAARVIRKKTTKKAATKKTTKKAAKKATKKAARKKAVKKTTAKKSSSRSTPKKMSFSKDHEVAYVLRKYNKRITAENKAKVREEGKKFKAMKSYAPHDKKSFYEYVRKKRVLTKLR